MVLCGKWSVVPRPWYEKYHGAMPIILLATALGLAHEVLRRRKVDWTRKNRKWFIITFVTIAPIFFFMQTIQGQFADYWHWQRMQRMAEEGVPSAQRDLGQRHLKEESYKDAFYWLALASNANPKGPLYIPKLRGDAAAKLSEEELKEVYDRARVWVPKATDKDEKLLVNLQPAESGDSAAQYRLGMYYKNRQGKGGYLQSVEAAKWLRKSAELGDEKAQNVLSDMYKNGEGVPQDLTEALYWSLLSSRKGVYRESKLLLKEVTPQQIYSVHVRLQEKFPGDMRLHEALKLTYSYSGLRPLSPEMTQESLCAEYEGLCDRLPRR
jgi:TPR repeat protein